MRILHIASEAVPWAKTGGLADVVGALCAHLAATGHEVALALPRYRDLMARGPHRDDPALELDLGPGGRAHVRRSDSGTGYDVWWVDVAPLFDRPGLYGTAEGDFEDNALRFATLVRAGLLAARRLDWQPDVIHAHDWQGALAPVLVEEARGTASAGSGPATVLTVHNMAYQGVFSLEEARAAALPDVKGLRQGDGVGLLKGGLLAANRVTTVSPTYAREIATPRFGFGLDGVISGLEPPVSGILNGLDTETWNPASDPFLPRNYDRDDVAGKTVCKAALQEELGLTVDPEVPLFGMVSRLVGQKGLSLMAELGEDLVERDAQFVFLGTGEARYERFIGELAVRYDHVAARLEFSEELAHRIEAGADFFLMPSGFEPCGLNQMISQRYGTPPVVHRVGGLADSVIHASPEALAAGEATGVVFDHFDAPALSWALDFAADLFEDREALAAVREAGMGQDFSWRRSGDEYERLYRLVVEERNGARG
ncbi:MAG: glycogen synthase GlgA [marine benthic group bacterium]|nr:glycogen synthase GlgA [Candidatus Benthicola marisminoris]